MALFDEAVQTVLEREGGYCNDPNDSGGETCFGITVDVARAHGYKGPMKDLDVFTAKDIYKRSYWDSQSLDSVALAAPLTAVKLFDIGVLSGITRSGMLLQRVLNVLNMPTHAHELYPEVKVDGHIGSDTVGAVNMLVAYRGPDGDKALYHGILALQGARFITIAEANMSQKTFAYGWLLHRVL
jgi:lysozyme family protein